MNQFPDENILEYFSYSKSSSSYLMYVEGECKISSFQPLKFSWLKAVPIIIISILTVIPAIIILNFKEVRKHLLYFICEFQQATHLFVHADDGNSDIVEVISYLGDLKTFQFKQLKYQLIGNDFTPFVFDYQKFLKEANLEKKIKLGLKEPEARTLRGQVGLNKHEVQIQNYFHYMGSVILQPLYILQYIVVLSLTVQGLPLFGIILIVASFITTSGNYIALYIGKRQIRKMAEKNILVTTIRQGNLKKIECIDLVPGDIIVFDQQTEIPCDCILIQGDLFVNESSLTGENIPIKKSSFKNGSNLDSHQIWLYDGTKVVQSNSAKALVVLTNFASKKGRLLRKILNRIPAQPDFFYKMFFFLLQSFLIAMVIYGATLPIRLNANIDKSIVVLRILDYLVSSVPPAFPIYFTVAYSWALYRLKKKKIQSTMPEKTVESNRLDTACFDKTGTLTTNSLGLKQLYEIQNQEIRIGAMHKDSNSQLERILKIAFGTCHSVRKVNDQFQGDQIDLKLWEYSKFKLLSASENLFQSSLKEKFKIIILNQFESRFQSMSVLIKEQETGKYYIFAKGAPEKIYGLSGCKIFGFTQFIGDLSFRGLRTIAFSWKQLTQEVAGIYLKKDRQQFLKGLKIMGIAAFENTLKVETLATIKTLQEAQINTRMITGDNIYIAVEIAYQSGILSSLESILILEGKKYQMASQKKMYDVMEISKRFGKNNKISKKMTLDQVYASDISIAIDNDFLSDEGFIISNQMKVFARILPEKKAYIISLIKQQFDQEHSALTCLRKYFEAGRKKVAMVGDGANDLMAIKEADVGIGISGTDAVYSAAFAVNNIEDVIEVVKEGKCSTANILQCLKFTLIANYVNLVVQALLSTEATFLSQFQGLYLNFLIIILVPIIMSLSGPGQKLTSFDIHDNFLNWRNQITVWLTILILAAGLISTYFYVVNSTNFIYNPKPTWVIGVGYNFQCQLVSYIFLGEGLILSSLGWIISQSYPFKTRIYENFTLILVIGINTIAFTVYFFILNPNGLGFLNLMGLASSQTGVQYAIIACSIILSYILNYLIHKLVYKEEGSEDKKNASLVKLNQTTNEIQLVQKPSELPIQMRF